MRDVRRRSGHTRRRAVDHRIVYGARCSWWDSVREAALSPTGLPCCPHCGGPLWEVPTDRVWWAGVIRHEAEGHPGYRAFVQWLKGRCYPSYDQARADYTAALAGS